jgi:hypothetical protein
MPAVSNARKFSISIDDFYGRYALDTPRIKACMEELIERYGITGKSVLSVGAGTAEEEKHFALAGNDLLLVDIDEQETLRPTIEEYPEKPGLSYWIGDAVELERQIGSCDVLYLSGFTPDELRRAAVIKKLGAAGESWRLTDEPFHPVVMRYASKVRDGGILLIQSYGTGLDTQHHPQYLAACQRQLSENGLDLFEVHRFSFHRAVMLHAISRGKKPTVPSRPLSAFHGRAKPETVERIFPDGIREPTPLQRARRLMRHLANFRNR